MTVVSLNSLPLGFRFRPTDVELIDFYLRMKINGHHDEVKVIREIDVCKWEPWDLPDLSVIRTKDSQWFFFCPRDRKYPNGQRLNRATGAGYWKATGKDRKITSGTTLIGMKKTLVFHTGRAPKGKKTCWVIHEYRAIQDDLDGSRPGQGAFVLCRLFKKQDDKGEGSSCDEAEFTVLSPSTAKSSPEDFQSEVELPQVSSVLEREVEKHPTEVESRLGYLSSPTTSNAKAPVDCHEDSCTAYNVDNQTAEITVAEGAAQLEEDLNLFYIPKVESLDCNLFSPLHSQIQSELGSSCMNYLATNDLSNSHAGFQFQYGTNETDACVAEFLNSILRSSDEYSDDESGSQRNSTAESEMPMSKAFVNVDGSCMESDADVDHSVAQGCYLLEPESLGTSWSSETVDRKVTSRMDTSVEDCRPPTCEEPSNHMDAVGQADTVGAGIRIRSRHRQNGPCTENPTQGNASRRLRLQCKIEIRPLHSINKLGNCNWLEEHESASIVTEDAKAAENENADGDAGSCLTKEALKKYLSESSENSKFSEELIPVERPNLRSKGCLPTDKQISPLLRTRASPARPSSWSFAVMHRIITVLVLFMILVGAWSITKLIAV